MLVMECCCPSQRSLPTSSKCKVQPVCLLAPRSLACVKVEDVYFLSLCRSHSICLQAGLESSFLGPLVAIVRLRQSWRLSRSIHSTLFQRREGRETMAQRTRPNLRYSALSSREELGKGDFPTREQQHEEEDLRFNYEVPDKVPCKSIALALFLLSLGCFFLVISHFLFTGHIGGDSSQAYGFLSLGLIVFIPGFYATRIAYYSWRGFNGYSFSRIPAY